MQLDFTNKPMVAAAFALADDHHFGIKRKYCGSPYIGHPVRVAERLLLFGHHSEEILSAALLHDCLEDDNLQGYTMPERRIVEHTNQRVLRWVQLLSNTEKGNRVQRKAAAALRIQNAPWEVQAIKLSDIMDNCKGLAAQDPGFASVYIEENMTLVKGLRPNRNIDGMVEAAREILAEEMNAVALWHLEQGRAEEAKLVERDAAIEAILVQQERSVFADFAQF